jgi:hypothetical protein
VASEYEFEAEEAENAEDYSLAGKDFADATSARSAAQADTTAASKAGGEAEAYENKVGPEEAKAAEEAAEAAQLEGQAKIGREDQKKDETTASEDKTQAGEKEHEAPVSKKLAEQKEHEAAEELQAAAVAEKA